ncbi:hypothetical protein ACYSNX_12235 [Myroides sp. LJL115]
MLNKSTKSEEQKRIEAIVEKLSSLGFEPESLTFKQQLNQVVAAIGLEYDMLYAMQPSVLVEHLHKFHFGWDQMEAFADILMQWQIQDNNFKDKAKYLYQYIQDNSKVFSFEIMTKLTRF